MSWHSKHIDWCFVLYTLFFFLFRSNYFIVSKQSETLWSTVHTHTLILEAKLVNSISNLKFIILHCFSTVAGDFPLFVVVYTWQMMCIHFTITQGASNWCCYCCHFCAFVSLFFLNLFILFFHWTRENMWWMSKRYPCFESSLDWCFVYFAQLSRISISS